ncbi:unnamed protein product [Symbiodinium necroappetens]|uniref:CAP-Gly domain-containing protein n=1 Tax=Symbiodinium necroappetens TaxID=1628268 RepID=A0A812ILR8_9DINO|nr:unnamed protein product [Symbiodinium necroappetens]
MDLPETVRVSAATRELIERREALQDVGEQPHGLTLRSSGEEPPAFSVQLDSHPISARCEVAPEGRRGVVRFVGCPGGVPRPLVAVELDSPQGEDVQEGGCWLDGVEYFVPSRPTAPVVWKTPKDVVCGNFPELDPFADLDSDSDQP